MSVTEVMDMARLNVTTGYKALSNTISVFFDVTLSALLLLLAAPFFVVISIAIKITDGGPIFYRGERLGKDKKIYMMYKFRSLVPDAERILGAELLSSQRDVITKVGRALRETRLDELPQLYNILRGDMTFIGPRPERAAIYEKFCKTIKGYDKRFEIKPGLIGYSQLFTPHSTPKRMRTLIDNMYIQKRQNILVDYVLVFYTAYLALKHALNKVILFAWKDLILRLFGRGGNKRYLVRIELQGARAYYGANGQFDKEGLLINVNEDAFLMYTNKPMEGEVNFRLEIFDKKKKTAFCTGTIYKTYASGNKDYEYAYVINYTPTSPMNSYMIHQYFLHKSVAEI
ncbi:MAG: sugar transferase [Candidatus Magnetominusculus sp. LBB02]|nr:sugar transferase [Candidatus Magnetominusculus sp. LBB02]